MKRLDDSGWWIRRRPREEEPTEDDHITLILSDGTVVYEDGYEPEEINEDEPY